MINRLDSLLHRPEKGWDPVPTGYAENYAGASWSLDTSSLIDDLERRLGSFAGKTVLDLGAGPGHYSAAFAKRGASVVWHDVSRAYLDIAERRAADAGVSIEFSLGYLEDASKFLSRGFDLVFCNLAWYYCIDDRRFAHLFYELVKPGGAGYIDCNTVIFDKPGTLRKALHGINRATGMKVGHLYPPHGRIATLFCAYPMQELILDYSTPENDRILFVKKRYD